MVLFNKKVVVINIEGMKCEHCVAKVTNALKKIHVKANVSLENKNATCTFNSKKVSEKQIKDTINKLGFVA